MSHMLHTAQTCVFADIREQIHVNAQCWCASMDPAFGGTGRELDRLPLEELESRYTAIREFLAKKGKWLWIRTECFEIAGVGHRMHCQEPLLSLASCTDAAAPPNQ